MLFLNFLLQEKKGRCKTKTIFRCLLKTKGRNTEKTDRHTDGRRDLQLDTNTTTLSASSFDLDFSFVKRVAGLHEKRSEKSF